MAMSGRPRHAIIEGMPTSDLTAPGRPPLWQRFQWLPYVLPLAVFVLLGQMEPVAGKPGPRLAGLEITRAAYPWIYTLKIALTAAALAGTWPGWRRLPWRVSLLGCLVGVVGAALWIGICALHIERRVLEPLGWQWLVDSGARSQFNPLEQLGAHPAWAWSFLVVRFLGLVVIIALAEELFLRGFVMRFVTADVWWRLPFGRVSQAALVAGTLLPMLMHPGELLAAAAWFSLVSWLMTRTRSFGDCVTAHALTNLLLGLYVVTTGHWELM